ncbi:TadE/TadG family type IV pilus assembly protein [Actinobacillus delphinicola]|nr:TadE/TadG family type IV pilus assembly protein [Actinobacillus delphinicola]
MMKQKKWFKHSQITQKLTHKLYDFYHDESGVYGVMTVLLTAGLIGYIAFVVDGTGILLDKARFTQGLEQGGLFLTAEDNYYRGNKKTWEVNSQASFPTGNLTAHQKNLIKVFEENAKANHLDFQGNKQKRDFAYKQYLRNIQMLEELVRSYYLPESYVDYTTNGNAQNNFNIDDHFSYRCDYLKSGKDVTNNIGCVVNGDFMRPSWLYWGDKYKNEYGTTFNRTEKITADTIFVTKKRENVPVDIIFVSDLSGSMNEGLSTSPNSTSKITMLRRVFKQIISDILKPSQTSIPNYNRIGFVDFALGAQQWHGDKQYCTLPYVLPDTKMEFYRIVHDWWKGDYYQEVSATLKDQMEYNYSHGYEYRDWSRFENGIDYLNTLRLIDTLSGSNLDTKNMVVFPKGRICLGKNKNDISTHAWYNSTSQDLAKAINDFNRITPDGGTLSSAGLILGTNMMMNVNPKTANLNTNTKRLIVILSDGYDEGADGDPSSITQTLIAPNSDGSLRADRFNNEGKNEMGLCDRIRRRVNTLQKSEYKTFNTKISFIAFGYGSKKELNSQDNQQAAAQQREAWHKCVGAGNYYSASNENELLAAFRAATSVTEEVGSVSDQKLQFAN